MSQTLDLLLKQYSGAHVIRINQAGAVIGLKKQSTYNAIQKKTFPIPVVVIGRNRGVRLLDLANYLDGLTPARRPGRPSHKERAAREAVRRGLTQKELAAQSTLKLEV